MFRNTIMVLPFHSPYPLSCSMSVPLILFIIVPFENIFLITPYTSFFVLFLFLGTSPFIPFEFLFLSFCSNYLYVMFVNVFFSDFLWWLPYST